MAQALGRDGLETGSQFVHIHHSSGSDPSQAAARASH